MAQLPQSSSMRNGSNSYTFRYHDFLHLFVYIHAMHYLKCISPQNLKSLCIDSIFACSFDLVVKSFSLDTYISKERISYNHIIFANSIMTEVIVGEQLELVSIVQVVQTSLSKNFTIVLRRLNHHDAMLSQMEMKNHTNKQETTNRIFQLEKTLLDHKASVSQKLEELMEKVKILADGQSTVRTGVEEGKTDIKIINEEIFRNQLKMEQKWKQKEKEAAEITRHVKLLAMEQNRLNDQISKKENRVQAEKIFKETQILKDKNSHIESELKIAHHKIEKMEILNQKAERLQAKKEVEIFKEIEERVKKEIKSNLNSPVMPNLQNQGLTSITMIGNLGKGGQIPMTGSGSPQYSNNNSEKAESQIHDQSDRVNRRGSIFIEDAGSSSLRSNFDTYLQKMSDKMKVFQTQVKEIVQNLKVLNKNAIKKESRQNKQNSQDGIKERINEIKPEIVKLWARLDTIDDKVSFGERKLDEKMKSINELSFLIKENNVSRLQEKIKNMQTEIFTSLKEIRSKLDTKLNQTEHDKYVKCVDEKIVQINDAIYLKSDKLEVKKALLFLEAKIKEIILVISEDEQNQKDALLTKKQIKCISCDKQLDKFSGIVTSPKGNWDGLPFKDHPSEVLGRFGMTGYGTLSKKIKKLQSKDLPILNKRSVNNSFQINS